MCDTSKEPHGLSDHKSEEKIEIFTELLAISLF